MQGYPRWGDLKHRWTSHCWLQCYAATRCNVMPPPATKRCTVIPPPISDGNLPPSTIQSHHWNRRGHEPQPDPRGQQDCLLSETSPQKGPGRSNLPKHFRQFTIEIRAALNMPWGRWVGKLPKWPVLFRIVTIPILLDPFRIPSAILEPMGALPQLSSSIPAVGSPTPRSSFKLLLNGLPCMAMKPCSTLAVARVRWRSASLHS